MTSKFDILDKQVTLAISNYKGGNDMGRKYDNDVLKYLPQWIRCGKTQLFYTSNQWEQVRAEAFDLFSGACVRCKSYGVFTPAVIGHHVNRLKKHPEYALTLWVGATNVQLQAALLSNRIDSNVIKYTSGGKLSEVICIDSRKHEIFIDLKTKKQLQILPLCRECHKVVHYEERNKLGLESNKKFPERW